MRAGVPNAQGLGPIICAQAVRRPSETDLLHRHFQRKGSCDILTWGSCDNRASILLPSLITFPKRFPFVMQFANFKQCMPPRLLQWHMCCDCSFYPPQAQYKFTLKHYAGPVCYDTMEFCEKNKDSTNPEAVAMLQKSKDAVASAFFAVAAPVAEAGSLIPWLSCCLVVWLSCCLVVWLSGCQIGCTQLSASFLRNRPVS